MEIVVHGLSGKTAEAFADSDGNRIGREMPAAVDRFQNRETGRGNSQSRPPQSFLEGFPCWLARLIMAYSLDFVKKKMGSTKWIGFICGLINANKPFSKPTALRDKTAILFFRRVLRPFLKGDDPP